MATWVSVGLVIGAFTDGYANKSHMWIMPLQSHGICSATLACLLASWMMALALCPIGIGLPKAATSTLGASVFSLTGRVATSAAALRPAALIRKRRRLIMLPPVTV